MVVSIPDLVDNMSGTSFKSIVCKKCMESEKINSECEFDGLKENRLSYKCRERGEIQHDSISQKVY